MAVLKILILRKIYKGSSVFRKVMDLKKKFDLFVLEGLENF